MKKKRKIAFAILIGFIILSGFVASDDIVENFEHRRDTQTSFIVTGIEHSVNASRGISVEFLIQGHTGSAFSDPLLKIRTNILTKTVSGNFYWYEEWGHVYAAVMSQVRYNFTHIFSLTGTWTIDINGYTTTITILR